MKRRVQRTERMRWRMIIGFSLFSLLFLWGSSPLWLVLFNLPEQLPTRGEIIALIGGSMLGMGICLHMQLTLDFASLQAYNATEDAVPEDNLQRGATLVVWLTAIINVGGNLLLGYDGMQHLIQSFSLALVIVPWFGIIQAWRHRPRS